MAHSKMDRWSLTLLISFVLLLSLFSAVSESGEGDDNNQLEHQLNIDGDDEAVKEWSDWSNYPDNGSWFQSSQMQHTANKKYYAPDGTQLLLFNSYMNHKADGGYKHLSSDGTTINIRNVVSYAVGVTMFKNSAINIKNCRKVVLGIDAKIPYNGTKKGYLRNTQVAVSNFEKLWIYDFSYSKSDGRALEIYGNGKSSVFIYSLDVHPSVMVNSEGVGIRNVKLLQFNSTNGYLRVTNHTPDMAIENVDTIQLYPWNDVEINNRYYSIDEGKWTKSGVGILTKDVRKLEGNYGFIIKNCEVGVEFENNGTEEGFNTSYHVHFVNCTHNFAYGGMYSSLPSGMGDMVTGFQYITAVLVAVAWMRIGVYYMSDKREKKELAKDMMQKAAIGSVIVAIVVYGYPIMAGMVNWIFGG